jgi:hypothetical protein
MAGTAEMARDDRILDGGDLRLGIGDAGRIGTDLAGDSNCTITRA